jgi:hypothetical protein
MQVAIPSLIGDTSMTGFKTRQVAIELEIPYHRLPDLIRSGAMAPPAKDFSGDYVWSPEDVERAREIIRARDTRRREASRLVYGRTSKAS